MGRVPDRAGLGLEIDEATLEAAHCLYESLPASGRNDAAAMQFLIPDWTFHSKTPALARERLVA